MVRKPAGRAVSHAFGLRVAAHGATVVLREPFDSSGMMQSALVDRTGMTRGAISKLADRRNAEGHRVNRGCEGSSHTGAAADRENGRKLVPLLAALVDNNDPEFFGYVTRPQP